MKKILLFTLAVAIISCSSLKASPHPNKPGQLAIKKIYSPKITDGLKIKLDSAVTAVMIQFNTENRSFKTVPTEESKEKILTIDFTSARIINRKQKRSSYIFNAVGLVVAPIISLSAGMGTPLMFNCLPRHKLKARFTIQSSLDTDSHTKTIKVSSGVLFADLDKKTNVMIEKFSKRFYGELLKIDKQFQSSNQITEELTK